jgi:hypothetical protein
MAISKEDVPCLLNYVERERLKARLDEAKFWNTPNNFCDRESGLPIAHLEYSPEQKARGLGCICPKCRHFADLQHRLQETSRSTSASGGIDSSVKMKDFGDIEGERRRKRIWRYTRTRKLMN